MLIVTSLIQARTNLSTSTCNLKTLTHTHRDIGREIEEKTTENDREREQCSESSQGIEGEKEIETQKHKQWMNLQAYIKYNLIIAFEWDFN